MASDPHKSGFAGLATQQAGAPRLPELSLILFGVLIFHFKIRRQDRCPWVPGHGYCRHRKTPWAPPPFSCPSTKTEEKQPLPDQSYKPEKEGEKIKVWQEFINTTLVKYIIIHNTVKSISINKNMLYLFQEFFVKGKHWVKNKVLLQTQLKSGVWFWINKLNCNGI